VSDFEREIAEVRRNSSPGGISTWKQCDVQLNRKQDDGPTHSAGHFGFGRQISNGKSGGLTVSGMTAGPSRVINYAAVKNLCGGEKPRTGGLAYCAVPFKRVEDLVAVDILTCAQAAQFGYGCCRTSRRADASVRWLANCRSLGRRSPCRKRPYPW